MKLLTVLLAIFAAGIGWAQYSPPSGGGGAVSSVFTRTGAVVATAGDYAANQVTGLAAVATSGSASDLGAGTLPAGRLPNPSASTLGGVQSKASSTHQFLNAVSTAGVPGAARPACADVSDAGAFCNSTDAAGLTGTINNARLPAAISIPGPLTLSGVGAGAVDLASGTTPSAPSSGIYTLFFNSGNSNHLSVEDSSAVVSDLQASGNAGALVLVEQHAASNSAEIDFTTCISATYDDYEIRIVDLIAGTDATNLQMQLGTGAGPTWDTSAHYDWARYYLQVNATFSAGAAGATSAAAFVPMILVSSSRPTQLEMRLPNPASSLDKIPNWRGIQFASDGQVYDNRGGGFWTQTTAVTGFRFTMSSGNIGSGNFRCYGVAK